MVWVVSMGICGIIYVMCKYVCYNLFVKMCGVFWRLFKYVIVVSGALYNLCTIYLML